MGAIKDLLDEWCKERNKELIDRYHSMGLKASGKFEKELRYDASDTQATIYAPPHVGAMVAGRSTTKTSTASSPTLRQVIRKWIDDKGITPEGKISKDSLAYLIARKIHSQGIKVPNAYNDGTLISSVITDEKIKDLQKQITENYITTFSKEIKETWRQQ